MVQHRDSAKVPSDLRRVTRYRIAVVGTVSSSLVSFRGPLLKALVDEGHEVFAFAVDYDESGMDAVRALGAVPVAYCMDRTGTNPVSDVRATLGLARLLRRHRIELMLSYFIKPVVYGTLAGVLAGVRQRFAMLPGLGYAFTESDDAGLRQRLLRGLLVRMLRFALARNRSLVLYNADDVAEVQRHSLVAPDKIARVNGTGIDLAQYAVCPPVTAPLTFLLAARLLREKGIAEYAEAARRVRRQAPQVRFVLLGGLDTSAWALQRDEVQQWVDEGVLEWPGQVPDIRPWLEQASVYVLPSYREGVPRSNQEAMAMGRPLITTDAPGCRETVRDGENGFLVPVRDAERLAGAMLRFVNQPSLVASMGAASRRLAEERFDVHAINRQLLAILSGRDPHPTAPTQ